MEEDKTSDIKNLVHHIDILIRKEKWFDFHVFHYDGLSLTIAGSIDLTYYHTLEVIFEDVFFVSAFFNGWHADTNSVVFALPDNEIVLNQQFEIEQGYHIFTFKTEDHKNDIFIAAKNLRFNTDTVYYHDKPELKLNERIASFVKK